MTEKRYPRTLQEAFGPYTSEQIDGGKPRDPLWVRCFYWLIALLAVGCFLSQLTGCSEPMTNDQVIAEVKKCHDAGMNANRYSHTWGPQTTHVVCGTVKR